MSWNLNPEYPIYTQIMEHITSDIISGVYLQDTKVPLCSRIGANCRS